MGKVKKTNSSKSSTTASNEEKPSRQLEDFQGFKVLPVIMDNTKNVRHFFYMKKHESKALVDENIKDRTLFLLNLPVDTTDHHIKKLFKGHAIEYITYHDAGSSFVEEYHKIAANAEKKELEAKPKTKKSKKQKQQEEEEAEKEKANVRELRRLFTSGSSAHVVFAHDEDLTEVLNMHRVEKKWAKDDELEQPLGFERKVAFFFVVKCIQMN